MNKCDIIINVSNTKFGCNRHVLCSVSKYFERMLSNENHFEDSSSSEIRVRGPHGNELKPEVMKLVFDFAASGEIPLDTTVIFDVLIAADYFEIAGLKSKCIEFLKATMTSQNWLQIRQVAVQLNLPALHSICMEKFHEVYHEINFSEVKYNDFLAIMKQQTAIMSGEDAFEALMMWATQNELNSQEKLRELLRTIDFVGMSEKFVRETILTNPVISSCPEAVQEISTALQCRQTFIAGGLGGQAEHSAVRYCPLRKTVIPCSPSPKPCYSAAAAVHGSKIVVVGGEGTLSDIQMYDLMEGTWSVTHSALQTSRVSAGAGVIGDRLYVVGGRKSDTGMGSREHLRTIEVFDLAGNELKFCEHNAMMPELLEARSYHAVVTRNELLFVCGGWGTKTGNNYLASTEVINTITNEIQHLPPLNEPRSLHAAVLFNYQLIVMGGWGVGRRNLSSVESYSFATGKWSFLPPMVRERYGHQAVVFDGKIFVIGGYKLSSVESYDPVTCQWSLHDDLEIPRFRSSVVRISQPY